MIQRTVGSQGNMKELATEKDLDGMCQFLNIIKIIENDIFVPSSLRGIDRASERGKTYDTKRTEPSK